MKENKKGKKRSRDLACDILLSFWVVKGKLEVVRCGDDGGLALRKLASELEMKKERKKKNKGKKKKKESKKAISSRNNMVAEER